MKRVKAPCIARCTSISRRIVTQNLVLGLRAIHGSHAAKPIIHVERADVYHFGSVQRSEAIFKDLTWTVNAGEAWAIVCNSNATRGEIFQMLLGRRRISPVPSKGLYPFLSISGQSSKDLEQGAVLHVAFASKKRIAGGGFTDYTARYGAMRDQDGRTLRDSLLESLANEPLAAPPTEFTPLETRAAHENAIPKDQCQEIDQVAEKLHLVPQLDLPLIALSNGQQRRARILRSLIRHPRLLLLEDPFAGLDVVQRPLLSNLLGQLNSEQDPFVVMELRPQDPMPEWITHVAVVDGQNFRLMARQDYSPFVQTDSLATSSASPVQSPTNASQEPLMDLNDVRIHYGKREVLRDVNWTIRPGDRWWLRGANGSGKTTLLSVLTGEHPQSYTQRHFRMFGKPRSQVPTVSIQRKVAVFTPEIFAAFPRKLGQGAMTARDAIGTGFENTYSYRSLNVEQMAAREELILRLAPGSTNEDKWQWSLTPFAELPPPEQALALFMRTLVAKAPILILDEVFGGMDDQMIKSCSDYLRDSIGQDQAVIFVSHWEHEIPWADVQKYQLAEGTGSVSVQK
ncbi:hypothetical protein M408DRAFT_174708 [Serendipita vermifera MAFF 305830]|uniref:ABC transporter domain-containing protein n=1 Tax=Serendipita vermifera MAFF 305830 TaxID=933852 RepID=A0A0C3B5X5_SERVB|nr:hypothetical protein M408DRAFT_174708 [Serendipita vermifera MAFF 305830]